MLEPWVRPRLAQFAYGGLVVAALAATVAPGAVSTPGGEVSFSLLMPVVAALLGVRLGGLTVGVWRGRDAMDWGTRALSWALFAFILFILSLLTLPSGMLALAAFVALDAAGGFAKRRPEGEERQSRLGRLAITRWPLFAGAYVLLVLAFHFLVAVHFTVGYLLDWTLVSLGFALGLYAALAAERAPEEALRPPAGHRRHARVERPSVDPTQRTGEAAARAFLFDGDAEPLLRLVRDVAAFADFPPREAKALEERVRVALARSGTSREDDLETALRALETSFAAGPLPEVKRR